MEEKQQPQTNEEKKEAKRKGNIAAVAKTSQINNNAKTTTV